jgi:hypothetical protein
LLLVLQLSRWAVAEEETATAIPAAFTLVASSKEIAARPGAYRQSKVSPIFKTPQTPSAHHLEIPSAVARSAGHALLGTEEDVDGGEKMVNNKNYRASRQFEGLAGEDGPSLRPDFVLLDGSPDNKKATPTNDVSYSFSDDGHLRANKQNEAAKEKGRTEEEAKRGGEKKEGIFFKHTSFFIFLFLLVY